MPRKPPRKPTETLIPMDGPTFVREFAARQSALLSEMAGAVKAGGVLLDESPRTDRYVEAVVSDWCSQQEPSRDAHLEMIGAVFLWALLDDVYGNGAANDNGAAQQHHRPQSQAADIALEALRTIQAIWGQRHG